MSKIDLPYGDAALSIQIPDRLLGEVIKPSTIVSEDDAADAVTSALDHPIGTARIEEIAGPRQRIVVIIDDISRETPIARLLPAVLDRLRRAGAGRDLIDIVVALGTHRPMTPAEIEAKVGSEIRRTFRIVNVPCDDRQSMVYKGDSSNGIPAYVQRTVAEADLRIGIGMITPHMDVGFSGGAKIILPGVCSRRTVDAFHSRQARLAGNQLGVIAAPMRIDLETFVGERIGLDFILNAVLNRGGGLYRCVAGHFIDAHRAGVGHAQKVYGVPVAGRYPLVVANAYPAQIDWWQSTKGIAGAELMTADGGTLVLMTPCPEGNRTHPLFADYLSRDPEDLLHELEAGRARDPVACAVAVPIARIKQRIRLALVSPGLSASLAERMGFIPYETVAEAIAGELPTDAGRNSIAVLTHGGVSLPLMGADSQNDPAGPQVLSPGGKI